LYCDIYFILFYFVLLYFIFIYFILFLFYLFICKREKEKKRKEKREKRKEKRKPCAISIGSETFLSGELFFKIKKEKKIVFFVIQFSF
jgi:hypothetical protein